MDTVIQCEIDLFSETLPSIEQICELCNFVNSSEINILDFAEKLRPKLAKRDPAISLAAGIGLFILGHNDRAVEKLTVAADGKEKFLYLAFALRRLGRFDEAIDNLDNAQKSGADKLTIKLEKAATHRCASNFDAAEKLLGDCENFKNVSADYHCQLARVQECQGLYAGAIENYQKAIELEPNHQKALFGLAYRCDLSGDEEAAIDYYKQIISTAPVYVNALINLAILYEDTGKFDKATSNIETVLQFHPNHKRALLFKKDIESSKTMFFDEEKELKKSKRHQILETPVSDFELSVRSRNCLRKMKIWTIGDLLNISEVELLSYKNFGETSLREIKAILELKGLRLGMSVEEQPAALAQNIDIADVQFEDIDNGLLNKPVDDLQLTVRSRKCLQKLNMRVLGDLTQKTEAELLGCKNFGVTSLNETKKALNDIGLGLRSLD